VEADLTTALVFVLMPYVAGLIVVWILITWGDK